MSSDTQDKLYKTFAEVSGKQASNLDQIANSVAGVVAQISKMAPAAQATPAAQAQTSSPASTGESTLSKVGSAASSVFEKAFPLVSLVSELVGLFGGGGSPAPAPLVKYAMPAKIDFEAADTSSGLSNSDYDQWGMPRVYTPRTATASDATSNSSNGANSGSNTGSSGSNSGSSGSNGGQAPQITVNVQAMDARSFLDRSSDIAAAVRDAMLNLNSINDVVNDL